MGGGKEIQERGDRCTRGQADSWWSRAETNTAVQSNYPPIKKITCQCRGHEFDPWSTGCGATKPEHLEPVLRSKRSHGNEKHARHCEEQPLLTTTRGNPHAGTKTWLSQRNKQIQKKNFLMLRKQNFLLDLPVSVLHSCYSRARGLVGEDDWLSRPQTHGWPLGRPRNFWNCAHVYLCIWLPACFWEESL